MESKISEICTEGAGARRACGRGNRAGIGPEDRAGFGVWAVVEGVGVCRDYRGIGCRAAHGFDLERAKFRVRDICVVAERGFVSEATIAGLEAMDPPVHYVIGVRMRRNREVGEVVLQNRDPWEEITPERIKSKDPAPLKVKEVEVGGRRYVVCLNEEERRP